VNNKGKTWGGIETFGAACLPVPGACVCFSVTGQSWRTPPVPVVRVVDGWVGLVVVVGAAGLVAHLLRLCLCDWGAGQWESRTRGRPGAEIAEWQNVV